MKNRILIIIGLLITHISFIYAQTNCNHEQLIMRFLQKISSAQYKSSLGDFVSFFDSESEIEFGLRNDYLKEHPNTKLSFETDSISLAIDQLLNNETMKHFRDLKFHKNSKWIIEKSHKEGSATIVYKIGIEMSKNIIYIQMVNWADKKRCGITDIRDSIGNSIYFIK